MLVKRIGVAGVAVLKAGRLEEADRRELLGICGGDSFQAFRMAAVQPYQQNNNSKSKRYTLRIWC